MNKKLVTIIASATLLVLPIAAFAIPANGGGTPTGGGALTVNTLIDTLLNFIWPLFMGFAVVMFLISGFQFLTAQGDPGKVDAARQSVLWGVVGVAMGVLAFSLPFIVKTTLGNAGVI